jgi:predicted CopG family antitoxin
MLNILYRFEPYYRLSTLYKLEQKHIFNGLLTIADEVYDEKLQIKNKESIADHDIESDEGLKKRPKNFINTLMSPKSGLTEEEIKHEINTLVAAVSRID